MYKNIGKISVVVLVLLAGAAAGIYFGRTPTIEAPIVTPLPSTDLLSLSIAPGSVLTGSVTFTGSLKGGYFFEANARGALLDAAKNEMKAFPISATSDWMTAEPVTFKAVVDTSSVQKGSGYLRIANDNPSGDPIYDKYIDIPVTFK
jgi:hypothetical protein